MPSRHFATAFVVAALSSGFCFMPASVRAAEALPGDRPARESSEAAARPLPEGCRVSPRPSLEENGFERSSDTRWNEHYLAAIGALTAENWEEAQRHFCAALAAAVDFGPRDWRFAETLDELGLVSFLSGDLELAEAMQGAAVAEMLLALGPAVAEFESPSPARRGRVSSVAIYAGRLNFLYTRLGKTALVTETERMPHRVLARGYLPLDAALASRLDWLTSRYLLAEDFGTARWLSALRSEILNGE